VILTLADLHKMEMDQVPREYGKDPDPEIWRWSPLDIREFDLMLHIAYSHYENIGADRQLSFLEAGCGIGTKLYLAKNKYRMQELGWELFADYLAICESLGVLAEQHDLRAESPDWGQFDVVFFGCPFKEPLVERAWELEIQNGMRPGAVLIGWHIAVRPYAWKELYRKPFRGVWVKPELPDESANLELVSSVTER
jgi:SAM-dependent methyltransferase